MTFSKRKLFPSPDETLETFGHGKVQILQKKKGYRFSVDTMILSEFVRIRKHEKVIDLGTGCGILPILLCRTTQARSFVGVEIQETLADLAERNVLLNGCQDRVTIVHEDYRTLRQLFPGGTFHVALSNPPYREFRSGRLNPALEKSIARHEVHGTIEELACVVAHLLLPKGRFYLIFPASRAVDAIANLRRHRLEPKRIRCVHPYAEREANFILVESVKDSGVELKIMPPLILHQFKL